MGRQNLQPPPRYIDPGPYSLAQIRGGGGAVPPEQVPGRNSSVNFGDN